MSLQFPNDGCLQISQMA